MSQIKTAQNVSEVKSASVCRRNRKRGEATQHGALDRQPPQFLGKERIQDRLYLNCNFISHCFRYINV